MKNIRVYQCEDSIESIFTAIYDAWSSRYGHDFNRIDVIIDQENSGNLELFSEYITVTTDIEKATKVAKSVKEKISLEAYDMVCNGALSDQRDKGDIIYRFLILGFYMGGKVVHHLGNGHVMKLYELNRNVSNEVHHYLGFLRFQEIYSHILFAKFSPKNDILRLIAPHFADRLANEKFIIYDEKRCSYIIHKAGYPWVYIQSDEHNFESMLELSNSEEEFQSLWRTFFETIGIQERKNEKLQRNNIPLRYRKYMTEFNEK